MASTFFAVTHIEVDGVCQVGGKIASASQQWFRRTLAGGKLANVIQEDLNSREVLKINP
jgi:hypothetical protein